MFKGGMANHIAAELEKFCPVEACEIEWNIKIYMYLSILSTPFYFTCLDGAELLKLRCYVIV
jgi:hypothetical protein